MASLAEEIPDAIGHELNLLEANPQLLHRDALRHEARIPEVALALGFATRDQAETGAQALVAASEGSNTIMENMHVYVAAEVPIL